MKQYGYLIASCTPKPHLIYNKTAVSECKKITNKKLKLFKK